MTKNMDVKTLLATIENSMKIAQSYDHISDNSYSNLTWPRFKQHIIVKEVYTPNKVAAAKWSVNQLFFKIIVVGHDGKEDTANKDMCVNGHTMSKIIATTGNGLNPKPKLVYDFTGHGASDIRYHGLTYSQAEADC